MSIHRAFRELIPNDGSFVVDGDEAHHALRTKRLDEGDILEILDGKGNIARAKIVGTDRVRRGKWTMRVEIVDLAVYPSPMPRLEVFSGVPKGPRLESLIEGLSQAGAALWRPMMVNRTVVDPRPTKLGRLGRVAQESVKQCGRAWALEIAAGINLPSALDQSASTKLVMADASGDPYEPSGSDSITLLVGPEGGFEPREIEAAQAAGAQIARFGQHTMRIETAATVAAGVILDLERRAAPASDSSVPSLERTEQ